jgi:hypothetical protein
MLAPAGPAAKSAAPSVAPRSRTFRRCDKVHPLACGAHSDGAPDQRKLSRSCSFGATSEHAPRPQRSAAQQPHSTSRRAHTSASSNTTGPTLVDEADATRQRTGSTIPGDDIRAKHTPRSRPARRTDTAATRRSERLRTRLAGACVGRPRSALGQQPLTPDPPGRSRRPPTVGPPSRRSSRARACWGPLETLASVGQRLQRRETGSGCGENWPLPGFCGG